MTDGPINKPFGVWGVLYKVFELPEWFGHITYGYREIQQEVVLESKKF